MMTGMPELKEGGTLGKNPGIRCLRTVGKEAGFAVDGVLSETEDNSVIRYEVFFGTR